MSEVLRRILAQQVTGRGVRGVVAAAAPMAAAIGAQALRDGGNAYDAAVAAALAETVLLPPKCGLAGDLIALSIDPDASAPQAWLAIGGAPAGLAEAITGGLPDTGPLAVGVPAAPAGYAALADRGRLGRARLAAPASDLARGGFPWAAICTTLTIESADLLRANNATSTSYLPGGRPIEPGTITRLPGLARVLDDWVERGAELFAGPLGDVVAARVEAAGGVLTRDDLQTASVERVAADRVSLDGGGTAWATPAPTHGPSLLEVVAAQAAAPDPTAVWGQVMGAITRRRKQLGDPRNDGTSMVSAADADGHVVVVVHSNSYPRYGSGLVIDEFDLVLANRAGRGFSATPGHPNFPRTGKRPATTLHAWAHTGPDGRMLLGATPGGVNQMPWNAQLLAAVVSGEAELGDLVTAPRWGWVPSRDDERDGVEIEAGLPEAVLERLRTEAGWTRMVPALGLRCAQQVIERPSAGAALRAAVDPRTEGAVVGV